MTKDFAVKIMVMIAVLIAILIGFIYILRTPTTNGGPGQYACTADAKICPDGTAVGRSGPLCEFEACPETPDLSSNIKIFEDRNLKIRFEYPEKISAKYIQTPIGTWPPIFSVDNKKYQCEESNGNANAQRKTYAVEVNNREYCVSSTSEGAAGSVYSDYVFTFPFDNETTGVLSFSLKFPQCLNYSEPEKTECSSERSSFDISRVIDQIAESIRVI